MGVARIDPGMTPLRVGLDLRSGREAWLGGVYYLQNLVLAVQTLPPDDRPELVALAPIDDPGIDIRRFERLVPLVPLRAETTPTRSRGRHSRPRAASFDEVPTLPSASPGRHARRMSTSSFPR